MAPPSHSQSNGPGAAPPRRLPAGGRVHARRPAGLAPALAGFLGACGGTPSAPVLNWYVNPDNGGQAKLAAKCQAASKGRYSIRVFGLPKEATQQREQLVRRLAAKDSSIDLMSLDLPFIPEFAEAGFLRLFTEGEAEQLTAGALEGPVRSSRWRGRLAGAPFTANTQLLWYRKSVARKAGLDPAARPLSWPDLVAAAERTRTTLEVQAKRYEGYAVWIQALLASAGGELLEDAGAGRDPKSKIDSAAGRKAAAVIRQLALSRAADPALPTADEEAARAAFQGPRGGFMVNWPYVYGAARAAVEEGSLDRAVLDDVGWARYPRVDPALPSRPPLGGTDIAVGAFGRHGELAVEATRCLTSRESQTEYMAAGENPAARAAVYDDPRVRKTFPMAQLIRESIADSAPRPRTPYYSDVSDSLVRVFHPPSEVEPDRTPARAARLIEEVLRDGALL